MYCSCQVRHLNWDYPVWMTIKYFLLLQCSAMYDSFKRFLLWWCNSKWFSSISSIDCNTSVNKKYSISNEAFIIQNLCWILKETSYAVIERTRVLIWNKYELVMLSLFVLLISKVLVNAHYLAVKFFFLLE